MIKRVIKLDRFYCINCRRFRRSNWAFKKGVEDSKLWMLGMHTWWTRRSVDITIVGKGRVRAVQFTIWFYSNRIGNFFTINVTFMYVLCSLKNWWIFVYVLLDHTRSLGCFFGMVYTQSSYFVFTIWFWMFTSSKKKNMKHSLQLWQRIRGLIKDHYRVAFCQLLFESSVSQIFYYLKYVV